MEERNPTAGIACTLTHKPINTNTKFRGLTAVAVEDTELLVVSKKDYSTFWPERHATIARIVAGLRRIPELSSLQMQEFLMVLCACTYKRLRKGKVIPQGKQRTNIILSGSVGPRKRKVALSKNALHEGRNKKSVGIRKHMRGNYFNLAASN